MARLLRASSGVSRLEWAWWAMRSQKRRRRASAGQEAVTLRTGLAAYWAMESTFGDVLGDSCGSNVLTGTGLSVVAGAVGQAYDAGYSGAVVSTWPVLAGAAEWSVSFWVLGSPPTDGTMGLFNVEGGLVVRVWNAAGMSSLLAGITDVNAASIETDPQWWFEDGAWNHVVITKSASAFKVYHAGAAVWAAGIGGHTFDNAGGLLHLGTDSFGLFDEVGIWHRELGAGEVEQLYNGGAGLGYEWL